MTKSIRVENACLSPFPVRVTIEHLQANGGWKPVSSVQLDQPTLQFSDYLTNTRRLVIEERDATPAPAPGPMGMALYQCHKQVRAAQIQGIQHGHPRSLLFIAGPEALVDDPVSVTTLVRDVDTAGLPNGIAKGWYFIEYADGYLSFSPPEAFESGYTKIEG